MLHRVATFTLILLLCFCGLWFFIADGAITSLTGKLDKEKAKEEILRQRNTSLEQALVRTRVQLHSLINANAVLGAKMETLQKQLEAQETELLKLKEESLHSGNENPKMDSAFSRVKDARPSVHSAQHKIKHLSDSVAFLIEYSELISEYKKK